MKPCSNCKGCSWLMSPDGGGRRCFHCGEPEPAEAPPTRPLDYEWETDPVEDYADNVRYSVEIVCLAIIAFAMAAILTMLAGAVVWQLFELIREIWYA